MNKVSTSMRLALNSAAALSPKHPLAQLIAAARNSGKGSINRHKWWSVQRKRRDRK